MNGLTAMVNPFRDSVVKDAWEVTVDLEDVHAEVFRACLDGIDSAARGVPHSLLIYGDAGSGKTHLLGRLQRHLAQTARNAPDRALHCVFSFVRLQTSPQLLWQHLRRQLVGDLMRREEGLTQLQRLIAHQLGRTSGSSPRAGILELRVLRHEDQRALTAHLSKVAEKLQLSRDLQIVLERLVFDREVRDARAWLAGESLPEAALAELGVGMDEDEDREAVARQVVTALCRLAGETLPIVFCFDQVESLQRTATDQEALFRFGRMAADLFDADKNVFVITCLQSALLDQFRTAVRQADLERAARDRVLLRPLTEDQLQRLLRARLDAVPELAALREQHRDDPLYPLGSRLIRELVAEGDCVPRRALALAARAFDQARGERPIARPTTAEFLKDELQGRFAEQLGSVEPTDTERIVLRGAELIASLEQAELSVHDAERADFVLRGGRQAAVSVRNEADGRRLTPRLKALLPHVPRKDGVRLVVVRDPRLPISKAAVKAREHLATLQQRGASLLEPSVEALAALEALSSLLGDAKSGDLANQEQALEPGAVLTWLRSVRDGELALEPLEELVAALFDGGTVEPDGLERDLVDLLSHEHVIELGMAAKLLNETTETVLGAARKAPAHCLLLEGPPALLLDMSGVAPEGEVAS